MKQLCTTLQKPSYVLLQAEVWIEKYVVPDLVRSGSFTSHLQQLVRAEALNSIGKLYSLAHPEMSDELCFWPG
jgi:hypothetical protein